MRKVFSKIVIILGTGLLFHGLSFAQTNPLYELPENIQSQSVVTETGDFLVATDAGLFSLSSNGKCRSLWSECKVSQIVKAASQWYFITENGVLKSSDLSTFEYCNNGLPVLTIKQYDGSSKSFIKRVHPLKDLCADPLDPSVLVTATKDAVYLTRDGGESWKNIGSTSRNTAGMKAVAVAHMPVYSNGTISGTELVVFQSHPIYGFSYCYADSAKPAWHDVSAGFQIMPSMKQVDEISDILPVLCKDESGNVYADIYCAQTFLPNLYHFNWKTKRAEKIYAGKEQADTIDGLCQSNNLLVFSVPGKVEAYSLTENTVISLPQSEYRVWKSLLNVPRSIVNAAYVPAELTGLETPLQLSELWLLKPELVLTPWGEKANNKKAIYVSPYFLRNTEGIAKYKKIITDNKLDAIVVDMKDDYGLLRFQPENALLKEKGKVSQYYVDLNQFITEFKKDNIYLVARIVVFKDRNLSRYGNSKYAVWNAEADSPWVGTKGNEDIVDEQGNVTGQKMTYYDENWVDPYSEEVWEYNITIAKELISRGFDEIQFDYIRFPTDGLNLSKAKFRWRDSGMDKESALVSFLSYARKNIDAPIGIDIYGANGWYRSGTRTGQDVELMSEYVDVICPMFYPSHFEQDFLEYTPVIERPYRIYFFGSYRNTVIGRNRIIVRPWAQAFYLNVRFDRNYYNSDYVKRQIFGVRDGLNRGYMYWNNSGRYDDICADPGEAEQSPWYENEGGLQTRKPAFSSSDPNFVAIEYPPMEDFVTAEKENSSRMIAVWNTVLQQDFSDSKTVPSAFWLNIQQGFEK